MFFYALNRTKSLFVCDDGLAKRNVVVGVRVAVSLGGLVYLMDGERIGSLARPLMSPRPFTIEGTPASGWKVISAVYLVTHCVLMCGKGLGSGGGPPQWQHRRPMSTLC